MIFHGTEDDLKRLHADMEAIPVDQRIPAPGGYAAAVNQTTIGRVVTVTGPSTYHKGQSRSLTFMPAQDGGWRFVRTDLPEQLPIDVCPGNVFNSRRNIVLQTGDPANRIRMTEHVIAHRLGMGIDNLVIETDTDDPPLFDVGSMPIVEALQNAGIREIPGHPAECWTPKEHVALMSPDGRSFLEFLPASQEDGQRLQLDVAIDFPTAIGRQRIQFDLTPEAFILGAHARTNCSLAQLRLFRLLGWLDSDTRHFGYTRDNILIAGKTKYVNAPGLLHDGKSLEAVWHRACLDLIAALSLFRHGRLAGKVRSYRAGHTLDCRFMNLMEIHDQWTLAGGHA